MHDQDTAITTAFVMEGMHDSGYDRALKAWQDGGNGGALELVEAIVEYVPVLLALRAAADEAMGVESYPGVFDYEVSHPMGVWLSYEVAAAGGMPDRAKGVAFAARLTREFFVRAHDENAEGVGEAITVAAEHLLATPLYQHVTHPIAGFTEGPWHVEPTDGNPNSLSIVKYDLGYIAEINRADDGLQDVDRADARLIAAAPDLYAALDRACTVHDENMSSGFGLLENEQLAYNAMCRALSLADGLPRITSPE